MISDRKDGAGEGDAAPLLGELDSSGYRRPLPGFSTNAPAFSANDGGTEGFWDGRALTGTMDRSLSEGETRRLPDLGIALKSIAAFWLLYIALITARAIVVQFPNFWEMMGRRAIAALVGCAITLQRLLSKYSAASFDSLTLSCCPVPRISSSHPFSYTNRASSLEITCEVP